MSNFISKYGMILPNSWSEQSENGILFTVEHTFLLDDLGRLDPSRIDYVNLLITKLWATNKGEYRTLPYDDNPRFSLDNMKAVAAFCRRYYWHPEARNNLRMLPLFRWYSIRPDSFCFLLYCKYPPLGWWFLWIPMIFMLASSLRPQNETSGKLLAYVQSRGAGMKLTWKLCKYFMGSVLIAWQIYFPEPDHPNVVLARELYKEEE